MWKLLFICVAPLFVATLQAERIAVPKARFSLDIPDNWHVLPASDFPDAADSMCFPRFRCGGSTISAGLWEYPGATLDTQIDAYFVRMNRYASGTYTRELNRKNFRSPYGVDGIRVLVVTGKENGAKWQLIRYVFRNSAGTVVCLSAQGDSEVLDNVVVNSLALIGMK